MGADTRKRHTDAFAAGKSIAKRRELDRQRYDTRIRFDRERESRSVNPIGRLLAHSTPRREDVQFYRPNYRQAGFSRREPPPRERETRDRDAPRSGNYEQLNPNPRAPRNNDKICRYCKNPGHVLEECHKRQFNNARRSEAGNSRSPSRPDAARQDGTQKTRPMNPIQIEEGSASE